MDWLLGEFRRIAGECERIEGEGTYSTLRLGS